MASPKQCPCGNDECRRILKQKDDDIFLAANLGQSLLKEVELLRGKVKEFEFLQTKHQEEEQAPELPSKCPEPQKQSKLPSAVLSLRKQEPKPTPYDDVDQLGKGISTSAFKPAIDSHFAAEIDNSLVKHARYLQQKLAFAESTRMELVDKLEYFEKSVLTLKRQNERLVSNEEKLNERIWELEISSQQHEEMKEVIESEVKKLKISIRSLHTEATSYKEQLEAMKGAEQHWNTSKDQLQSKLEREVNGRRKLILALQREKSELTEKNVELMRQLETLQQVKKRYLVKRDSEVDEDEESLMNSNDGRGNSVNPTPNGSPTKTSNSLFLDSVSASLHHAHQQNEALRTENKLLHREIQELKGLLNEAQETIENFNVKPNDDEVKLDDYNSFLEMGGDQSWDEKSFLKTNQAIGDIFTMDRMKKMERLESEQTITLLELTDEFAKVEVEEIMAPSAAENPSVKSVEDQTMREIGTKESANNTTDSSSEPNVETLSQILTTASAESPHSVETQDISPSIEREEEVLVVPFVGREKRTNSQEVREQYLAGDSTKAVKLKPLLRHKESEGQIAATSFVEDKRSKSQEGRKEASRSVSREAAGQPKIVTDHRDPGAPIVVSSGEDEIMAISVPHNSPIARNDTPIKSSTEGVTVRISESRPGTFAENLQAQTSIDPRGSTCQKIPKARQSNVDLPIKKGKSKLPSNRNAALDGESRPDGDLSKKETVSISLEHDDGADETLSAQVQDKGVSLMMGLGQYPGSAIEGLTSAMIGAWFQKYNRFGKNPKLRFFWVDPYRRCLNWAEAPLNQRKKVTSKSAFIEDIFWSDLPENHRNYPPNEEHTLTIRSSSRTIILIPTSWNDFYSWIVGIQLLLSKSSDTTPDVFGADDTDQSIDSNEMGQGHGMLEPRQLPGTLADTRPHEDHGSPFHIRSVSTASPRPKAPHNPLNDAHQDRARVDVSSPLRRYSLLRRRPSTDLDVKNSPGHSREGRLSERHAHSTSSSLDEEDDFGGRVALDDERPLTPTRRGMFRTGSIGLIHPMRRMRSTSLLRGSERDGGQEG